MTKSDKKLIDEIVSNLIAAINEADTDSQAKQIGFIGNEPVFWFCQQIKGYFPENTQAEDAEVYFLEWFDGLNYKIIDEGGLLISQDEAVAMFYECWDKVKFPRGAKNQIALERARKRKSKLPELNQLNDPNMILLATVCYELQQISGGDSFFLSGYDAGNILVYGKFQKQKNESIGKRGNRILKRLEYLGIIGKLKQGVNGYSSTYQFLTDNSAVADLTCQQKKQKALESLRK